MQSSVKELPAVLYESWCRLYNAVAEHTPRVVRLLEDRDSDFHTGLKDIPRNVQELAARFSRLEQRLKKLDDDLLLDALAHLRRLDKLYKLNRRRTLSTSLPEVKLRRHRYVLVPPVDGPILEAVPEEQRFILYSDMGNERVLQLSYHWKHIPDGTQLDWRSDNCLNVLIGLDIVRIGVSPFAKADDMKWYPHDMIKRTVKDEAPLQCVEAKDLDRLWGRLLLVLKQARKEKVHVLLLPELVVPDALLIKIKGWLSKYNDAENGVMCLLVAGTRHCSTVSPSPAFHNRCTVMDGAGKVMWEQDKRVRFHVSSADVRALLTTGASVPVSTYYEPTHPSDTVVIRQTALGLVMTPICLDFFRDPIWEQLVADVYFVPAMSTHLQDFQNHAWRLGRWGSASFVCNADTGKVIDKRRVLYIPIRSKTTPEIREVNPNLFVLDVPVSTSFNDGSPAHRW